MILLPNCSDSDFIMWSESQVLEGGLVKTPDLSSGKIVGVLGHGTECKG